MLQKLLPVTVVEIVLIGRLRSSTLAGRHIYSRVGLRTFVLQVFGILTLAQGLDKEDSWITIPIVRW